MNDAKEAVNMKMKWYDRILVVLCGLLLVGMGVFSILVGIGVPAGPYQLVANVAEAVISPGFSSAIRSGQWYVIVLFICAGILILAWGLRIIVMPFLKKRGESYFSAPNVQNGSLQISIHALEQLISKSLMKYPELTATSIRIIGNGEAIRIRLQTTLQSGVHIPKLTAQVREDITQYLMTCSGVQVSDVDIIVEDTKAAPDLPELMPAPAAMPPASEPEKVPEQFGFDTRKDHAFTGSFAATETFEPVAPTADDVATTAESMPQETSGAEKLEAVDAEPVADDHAEGEDNA